MIKLKEFAVSNIDKANDFLEKFAPYFIQGYGGIHFTDNAIMVVYDDGIPHPSRKKSIVMNDIDQNIKKKILLETKIETATFGLEDLVKECGYKGDLDKIDEKEFYKLPKIKEMPSAQRESMLQRILTLKGTIFVNQNELKNIDFEIEGGLKVLKTLK